MLFHGHETNNISDTDWPIICISVQRKPEKTIFSMGMFFKNSISAVFIMSVLVDVT
jgi:hypothetical protein